MKKEASEHICWSVCTGTRPRSRLRNANDNRCRMAAAMNAYRAGLNSLRRCRTTLTRASTKPSEYSTSAARSSSMLCASILRIIRSAVRGGSRFRSGRGAQNASRARSQVRVNSSGSTRVSPITVAKFESATQRGRTCMWMWPSTPAPAARPMFMPIFMPSGLYSACNRRSIRRVRRIISAAAAGGASLSVAACAYGITIM